MDIPQIPVSPPTRTSPIKIELTPDGHHIRVTTYGELTDVVHDLRPTEAIWIATQLRAHALAVIEEGRAAAQLGPFPEDL